MQICKAESQPVFPVGRLTSSEHFPNIHYLTYRRNAALITVPDGLFFCLQHPPVVRQNWDFLPDLFSTCILVSPVNLYQHETEWQNTECGLCLRKQQRIHSNENSRQDFLKWTIMPDSFLWRYLWSGPLGCREKPNSARSSEDSILGWVSILAWIKWSKWAEKPTL